jgi:hypothetical protein
VSRGAAIQVVGSRENHGATEWHRIATEVAKLEVYQRQVHSEDFKESTNNMEDATQSEKNGKKSGRKKQAEPKMREVRKQAVAVMCPKVTGIAKKLTEMAEQGNCQAAKLVFEFLGDFPAAASGGRERRYAGAVSAAAIRNSRSPQRRGNYESTERGK